MYRLEVHGGTGHSSILVGERLAALGEYLPAERVVIITDTNVWDLYGKMFPGPARHQDRIG